MLDPLASISTERSRRLAGREKTPIIVHDDFLSDLDGFLEATFKNVIFQKEVSTYYPGFRSPLSKTYTLSTLKKIHKDIIQTYDTDAKKKLTISSAFYSYVSSPESELLPLQCIPHYDNTQPLSFAIMHYLNPGDFSGTGFFRHKPTGFETINIERKDEYIHARNAYLKKHGQPEKKYTNNSNEHFELTASINYKANRLIVYPAGVLHSGLIDPGKDIHTQAQTARLTANIFIDFI